LRSLANRCRICLFHGVIPHLWRLLFVVFAPCFHDIENTGDSDMVLLEMFKSPVYQDLSFTE